MGDRCGWKDGRQVELEGWETGGTGILEGRQVKLEGWETRRAESSDAVRQVRL